MHQPADAYMLGHSKIGDAVRRAGLMAGAGVPFMLQNTGGAITRAMVLHMMCTCAHLTASRWHGDSHTRLCPSSHRDISRVHVR